MLIVPDWSLSQKHALSFPCTLDARLPPLTKKKEGLEAPKRSILSFLFQRMQCFVLTSAGKEMKGSVIKPKGLSVLIKWPFTPDL